MLRANGGDIFPEVPCVSFRIVESLPHEQCFISSEARCPNNSPMSSTMADHGRNLPADHEKIRLTAENLTTFADHETIRSTAEN